MGDTLLERAVAECPITVKGKDQRFAYRWVNKDRVEEYKSKNWIVVPSDDKVNPVGRTHVSENVVRYKTLILMKKARELYEEGREKKAQKAKEQIESIQKDFEKEGKKNKVKIIKGEEEQNKKLGGE